MIDRSAPMAIEYLLLLFLATSLTNKLYLSNLPTVYRINSQTVTRRLLSSMAHSDTSSPRSLAANLLSRSPPPNIPTSQPHSSTLQSQIKSLPSSLPLTQAALHLANDDLKNCHEIVQNMEGDEMGKLLHQTMHRREGDYWNSNW